MSMSSAFVTLDKKGRATLPEDVRTALGVEAGDFIILERTERGTYELVPAALVPKDQIWFYHPEMQGRIRKAEKSIAAGSVTTSRSLAEAKKSLVGLKGRPRRKHK
jgi:AbrB family looped-hinge helix DNA binding protein